jgi:hypothetical protein
METKKNISVCCVVLPYKPLDNLELADAVNKLRIPAFRGVFLRDTLPKKPEKKECGILNLDNSSGSGTHWVAWYKNGDVKYYFDSYGVQPPTEIVIYLKSSVKSPLLCNTEQIQPRGEVFCGHLCLYVLKQLSVGKNFQEIINYLY